MATEFHIGRANFLLSFLPLKGKTFYIWSQKWNAMSLRCVGVQAFRKEKCVEVKMATRFAACDCNCLASYEPGRVGSKASNGEEVGLSVLKFVQLWIGVLEIGRIEDYVGHTQCYVPR